MFGIQKKGKAQQPQDAKGGMIKGKGTGTSDDIKKNVESGSYIMPADSTQQIGEDNLDKMGSSPRVNLSNGEYELTPNEVHSIGVSTLERMKDQTHAPVNQPQLGIKSGQTQPELFFANGGLVISPYPSADDIRKAAAQKQIGGPTMRDVSGVTRDVNRPLPQTYQAPSTPAANPASTAPAQGGGFMGGVKNMAKGLGKFHGVGSMAGGAVTGFNTSTEDYAERMGLDPNAERGALVETGIRAAGVLSDVGNAASFGILGNRFPDKQRAAAEQGLAEQQARFAAHNASKSAQPVSKPTVPALGKQPSFNDTLNTELYGTAPTTPPTQTVPQQNADPYAIQQKGSSFSYANPNAANQARAAGVPELQSSGFAGGIRPANDPRGVANLMQNTRELGPTDQQVNQALNQLNGQQGQGVTYPNRPTRTDEQEAERRNLISDIRAPIAGARGMTTNQRAQLLDLQNGDDNRATTMYNTDANNATSQLNNSTNNAASIAQTMMREQGSNDRAVLGENGQNSRYGMGLEQDAAKFNAEFGLKNREAKLNETKEGFGIRNSQRVEKLYEMYDKAETDEQRASIQERINRFTGAKGESGKDRYMTVGGGQEWNEQAAAMVNRPQQIFDTKTGQLQNMGSQTQSGTSGTAAHKEGMVYTDKDGNQAVFRNGQFMPIK